jgi:hypothetical protein
MLPVDQEYWAHPSMRLGNASERRTADQARHRQSDHDFGSATASNNDVLLLGQAAQDIHPLVQDTNDLDVTTGARAVKQEMGSHC